LQLYDGTLWDNNPATVFATYERARNAARRRQRFSGRRKYRWGKSHEIVPVVAEPEEDTT